MWSNRKSRDFSGSAFNSKNYFNNLQIEYPPPEIYCRKILNKDPRIQDQQTPIDY